jgi:4-diphosphocytidyl-2-C-methyl-D-erythritol kinase
MTLQVKSPCKINLLLNILGKRPDGFHELETVMQPLPIFDDLEFETGGNGIQLTCDNPALPVDNQNLVYRAAEKFRLEARITEGVTIRLNKKIPLAAGLGGGSANAAMTLIALNNLFDRPLSDERLKEMAAGLGSDVPFFLGEGPALATGRGERIQRLNPFLALKGLALFLVHPGFGIATAWAYQKLQKFPGALNGQSGRAEKLATSLGSGSVSEAMSGLYNSLEAPALEKYPILQLYQDFLRQEGALGTLMSGSGSTTFAFFETVAQGEQIAEKFREKFGEPHWLKVVSLDGIQRPRTAID